MPQAEPFIGTGEFKLINKIGAGDVISCPPAGTRWDQGWEFGNFDRTWETVKSCKRYRHTRPSGDHEWRYRIYTESGLMVMCPTGQYIEVKS